MPVEFKVTADEADGLRSHLIEKISGSHVGLDGSYEEGIIDAIAWLLGDEEKPQWP